MEQPPVAVPSTRLDVPAGLQYKPRVLKKQPLKPAKEWMWPARETQAMSKHLSSISCLKRSRLKEGLPTTDDLIKKKKSVTGVLSCMGFSSFQMESS